MDIKLHLVLAFRCVLGRIRRSDERHGQSGRLLWKACGCQVGRSWCQCSHKPGIHTQYFPPSVKAPSNNLMPPSLRLPSWQGVQGVRRVAMPRKSRCHCQLGSGGCRLYFAGQCHCPCPCVHGRTVSPQEPPPIASPRGHSHATATDRHPTATATDRHPPTATATATAADPGHRPPPPRRTPKPLATPARRQSSAVPYMQAGHRLSQFRSHRPHVV